MEKIKGRFHRMMTYYKFGHIQRQPWRTLWWRVGVTLLAMLTLFIVQDYLYKKYGVLSTAYAPAFIVAEKLFYWFIAGFLFGVVAFTLITEGEYLIGLWKIAKAMEQVKKGVERIERGIVREAKKEVKRFMPPAKAGKRR